MEPVYEGIDSVTGKAYRVISISEADDSSYWGNATIDLNVDATNFRLKETGETMTESNMLRMVYVVRTDGDEYEIKSFGPFVSDAWPQLVAAVLLRYGLDDIFEGADENDLTFVPVTIGDVKIPYLDGVEND